MYTQAKPNPGSFERYKKFSVPSLFNTRTVLTVVTLLMCLIASLLKIYERPNSLGWLYLLCVVQVAPFAITFSRQHYNYIGFVLMNHFLTYSIAKYNQVTNLYKVDYLFPEAIMTIQELIICSLLILFAYIACRQFFFFRFVHKERFQLLSLTRLQLIIASGYVVVVTMLGDNLPAMVLAIHFAATSADMVLLLCSNSPGNERLAFYMRLMVFAATFFYFVSTGFLTLVGNLATYMFITGCLQKSWRTLLVPVLLALLASAIQSVKFEYRLMLRQDYNASVVQKIGWLSELMTERYFGSILGEDVQLTEEDVEKVQEEEAGLLQGFARIGDDSLERVLVWTPSKVPYWGGETYSSIPYMFIPRFLWPDKPTRHIWNKFGRVYGYLSSDDNETSVGVGYLAEGYMNFGYPGLYGVAILVGFIVALVERLSYYFLGGYFYFTYVCFLMPVMQPASDLSSMIMSVVIVGCVLFMFRTQFVKMARKDEYS